MAENGLDDKLLQKTAVDMKASGDILQTRLPDIYSHHLDLQGRPGSQLSDRLTFTDKKGNSVSAYPVIVDLRRLMQLGTTESMIKGVSNKDLLHAVVALYDVSLSEMTPDVLYATVCDKWARTVVLVRDIKETQESLNTAKQSGEKDRKVSEADGDKDDDKSHVIDEETDTYEGEDATPSVFADIFSDSEEEEEEEEESDEEDFSKGIGTFIKTVSERRKKRRTQNGQIELGQIGIENRLLACATFEKKFVRHKDRVIHLTLISVRPTYRGFGLGKSLMSQVVDPTVVGNYEAVVVHADNSAVEFFQKFGFSDDTVLNSRWSELAEQFTNCTLMCFLPGFTGLTLLNTSKAMGTEVIEMEQEFNMWKDKTLMAYQAQVSCVMRMKHEILQLKAIVKSQSDLMTKLSMENDKLQKEKATVEKDFIAYRLSTARVAFHTGDMLTDDNQEGDEDICTDTLIQGLQQQLDMMDASLNNRSLHMVSPEKTGDKHMVTSIGDSSYLSFPCARVRSQQDPNNHSKDSTMFCDVTQEFQEGMKADKTIRNTYEVTSITKAVLPDSVKKAYQSRRDHLGDGSMVTELYYCGSLQRPERIQEILDSGFSDADFSYGEYGRGLYFSKYPSKAAQFSAFSRLVLVEVGLGKVETVTKQDRTRQHCSPNFDSIITPGRLRKDDCDPEPTLLQEYVVFDLTQVLPLCLISYETAL
ncbi:uncharacterized protein [Haliotis cracherodii]|uniref:uncharacterized protein isoform X1 n=1 Tax=Haliotis cracherodii TaxID=6455 RepID=UPI0039E885ED